MNAEEKKRQIIDLWQTCFHDSDEFIRLYFTEIYHDENAMIIAEGDRVLSALQMIPYEMTCWGVPLPMSYIAGASTYPEARNRRLMSDLLHTSIRTMKSRGIALTTLMPADDWLFGYYARFGYVTACFEQIERKRFPAHPICPPPKTTVSPNHQFAYFRQEMQKRSCCVQHSRTDFDALAQDLRFCHGAVVTVMRSGQICGLAMAIPEKEFAYVLDGVYDDDEARQQLLRTCAERFAKQEVRCRVPGGKEDTPSGMIRIIDAGRVLSLFAELNSEQNLTLKVNDPLIPENNALFAINGGRCTRGCRNESGIDLELTIDELTRRIFAGGHPSFSEQQPFMSLMFD